MATDHWQPKDVCIVGFGAIGALYSWALEKSGKARVTAVCRSNYQTLKEFGLHFESDRLGSTATNDGSGSPWNPYRVVKTVEDAADRPYEYIICATKCVPETSPTDTLLAPLLSNISPYAVSSIILLQNGVGIEDSIISELHNRKLADRVVVVSGCAWVDATAIDGGKKVTQFGNEKLVLGVHQPNLTGTKGKDKLTEFCEMLQLAGADAVPTTDIDIARWRKVLWNASFSTISTLTRCTIGEVLAVQEIRAELAAIMAEVLSVAHAALPPSDSLSSTLSTSVVQEIIANENPKSNFKPSMLVDLEARRPMEVEAIVGGVLHKAKAAGVKVPRLELVYASLKVIQLGLLTDKRRQM